MEWIIHEVQLRFISGVLSNLPLTSVLFWCDNIHWNEECHFHLLYPSRMEAFVCSVCVWGGCPCHRPPKQWFQSFCKYCVFPPNDLWSPMEDLRGFHRYHYLGGAHRRWERGCQRLEICHLPTSATNPFRIYVAAIHFRNELNLSNDEFGLELDRRQLPPLQLQTMPTGWQALPLMRKVRGPSRRDWQSIPEYPSPAGHDWVLAQRDLQNFPGELMGQSVHLSGMPDRPASQPPNPFKSPLTLIRGIFFLLLFMSLDSCSHIKAPVHFSKDFHLGKFYDTLWMCKVFN